MGAMSGEGSEGAEGLTGARQGGLGFCSLKVGTVSSAEYHDSIQRSDHVYDVDPARRCAARLLLESIRALPFL